jgi:hypothetical protein
MHQWGVFFWCRLLPKHLHRRLLQDAAHLALIRVRQTGALNEQHDGEAAGGVDPGLGAIRTAMVLTPRNDNQASSALSELPNAY